MSIGSIDEKAMKEVMVDLVSSSGKERENPTVPDFALHHGGVSKEGERNVGRKGRGRR
ncbi:UNVERIFIED_CONTAM: hypothetical protein Sradi_3780700 [Sesamum radiatum]|uniref:Uncharacterized protein n=1 Tax=Sesamum radiatum TaxID=300843 RepID=A0AAW2PZS0_SESRA